LKNNKIYFSLIIIACAIIGFGFKENFLAQGVAVGDTVKSEDTPSEWNKLIAEDVNQKKVQLVVDGNAVPFYNEQIYMDNDMNLMIPASIFTKAFSCSYNCYDNDRVLIKKGLPKLPLNWVRIRFP
jgi:hypothetical protein